VGLSLLLTVDEQYVRRPIVGGRRSAPRGRDECASGRRRRKLRSFATCTITRWSVNSWNIRWVAMEQLSFLRLRRHPNACHGSSVECQRTEV